MKTLLFILSIGILSCTSDSTKERELDLREKELSIKERELDLQEQTAAGEVTEGQVVDENSTSLDEEAEIKVIRAEFKRINAMSLSKNSFDWEGVNCGQGTIVYYLENGKIVKIIESGQIGDGDWIREFYYKNGNFIFSYYIYHGGPVNGPIVKSELRTYAHNDKLFRMIEDKTIIDPETTQLDNSSLEYRILKAYLTREFSKAICDG